MAMGRAKEFQLQLKMASWVGSHFVVFSWAPFVCLDSQMLLGWTIRTISFAFTVGPGDMSFPKYVIFQVTSKQPLLDFLCVTRKHRVRSVQLSSLGYFTRFISITMKCFLHCYYIILSVYFFIPMFLMFRWELIKLIIIIINSVFLGVRNE